METFPTPLPAWLTVKPTLTYPAWKLERVGYYQENDGSGNWNGSVNIYLKTLDKDGNYQKGIKVWQAYPSDKAETLTRAKGDLDYGKDKEPFGAAFEMSHDSIFYPDRGQTGPYWVYVDGNSDQLWGMGLPVARHNQFVAVFRWTEAPPPSPHLTLEETVLQVESTYPRLPINTDAALYKRAQALGLGQAQGDEHHFMWNGGAYVFQTFNSGIVYALLTNVNDVSVIEK